jgi:hypothetical protein
MMEPNPRFTSIRIAEQLQKELAGQQADADSNAAIRMRQQSPPDAQMQQAANNTAASLVSTQKALEQEFDAEPKLFSANNTDPIALLPLRIETIWWTPTGEVPDFDQVAAGNAVMPSLRVRVYPDDVHLTHLDRQITESEARAGTTYWQDPTPQSWQSFLQHVRPSRAAWVARTMKPPGPPAGVIRPDNAARPSRSFTLPERWRFIGFVDGEVVVDETGNPIPNPLPLDILDVDESWSTSWDEALFRGMAIELPNTFDHLDQLIVVGVSAADKDSGASYLQDLLRDHAFSAGLGFVHAGTPTNNTPTSRSGWSTQPAHLPPDGDPGPGQRPVADALAQALGLPDAGFLRSCSGADDPEFAAVAALSLLTWASLSHGFTEAAGTHVDVVGSGDRVRTDDTSEPWREVRDHLIGHVRSRGPLPALRVGSQPYGVLPVSSLRAWRSADGDTAAPMLPWLLRLRETWRAALSAVPSITVPDQAAAPDQLVTNVLQRQPTTTGLLTQRVNGPAETVAEIPPGEAPTSLQLGGVAPDSALRWSRVHNSVPVVIGGLDNLGKRAPDGVLAFVSTLADGHDSFLAAARATADYFETVRTFMTGDLSVAAAQAFHAAWPVERADGETPTRRTTFIDMPDDAGLLEGLVCVTNWAFPEPDDPLGQAFMVSGDIDQLVVDILDGPANPTGTQLADRRARAAAAARWADPLGRIADAARQLEPIPLPRIIELVMEVVDVYAHRLDAWVTSLATRRLGAVRATTATGIRLGAYGWVENLPRMAERILAPAKPGQRAAIMSQQDGYIHAPSLQQATAAAVLRSGALTRPGETVYDVNLDSRRSRIARWLLGGVREGQHLGELLGYRFERALHDAGLDPDIPHYRNTFGAPVVPERTEPPPGTDDRWAESAEAVGARNVVDGVKLVAAGDSAADLSAEPARMRSILDELAGALDAVADLLLAESVHQLVAGNPLRAGLAADTLGRGNDVPDTFATLTTPHRARAVTHRLATLLPSDTAGDTGWPADDLSRLAPGIEAWVAHLLGPAAGWTLGRGDITCTVDRLGLSALATVLDASAAQPASLTGAFLAVNPTATATGSFDNTGWAGLRGMALRLRSLLAGAQPLRPDHLPGTDTRTCNVTATRQRVIAFADLDWVRAHPRHGALAEAAAAELLPADAIPAPDDRRVTMDAWLSTTRTALSDVIGAEIPLLLDISGPPPVNHPGLTAGDIDAWLLRFSRVRPEVRTLHDTLLLSGVRGRRSETLFATQGSVNAADKWVGAQYAATGCPPVGIHLVWHQPVNSASVTGLVFDEWVELLPGADYIRRNRRNTPPITSPPESELTGVAFHYDRPDAKAAQSLLIAVPPNLDRGWTPDTLVQVLRETLELGKLRGVDLGDLPSVGSLLPAIRIGATTPTGRVLAQLEQQPPNTEDGRVFRFDPTCRTPYGVDDGLAARVHDPLWLMTRQWQLGEFAAQDAGSPALVTLSGSSDFINGWRPAGATDWIPYQPTAIPLNVVIEAEQAPTELDLRIRVDGGSHFRTMLADAGQLDRFGTLFGIQVQLDTSDSSTVSLLGPIGGSVPDAQALQLGITSGSLPPELHDIPQKWGAWWDAEVADHSPDCFDENRFEHAFELSVGGSVLRASEYTGDGLDWFSLDVAADAARPNVPPTRPYTFSDQSFPSPVRYGGLPADRFWEMEDARIDLGATDVSTLDTGRLLLISFATIYGNDWFLTPLEVPVGSLTTLTTMVVADVFGRTHLIGRAGQDEAGEQNPSWSMYSLYSDEPDHPATKALLMMPCTQGHTGEPLEQISLTRDELANLAWAIQHRITDSPGDLVDCRNQWMRMHAADAPEIQPDPALPAYRVETTVPDYWFPLVPVATAPGVIRFNLAEINERDHTSAPRGRLITPGLWLHEEEVPRGGAVVQRRPMLARWFDGSWHSWVRREKTPGTGDSSSGLAFDNVWPSEPWPR